MSYLFKSFLRPKPDFPWEELCRSDDADKGASEDMCRQLAAKLFYSRLTQGRFRVDQASLVTLPAALSPYGPGMKRRTL